jgi:hypothetical protein
MAAPQGRACDRMRPRSLVQVSKSGLPFTRTWIHPVNLLPLDGLAHINNGSWSTVNKPATPVSSASQQRPQVSQQQRSTPAAAGNPTQAKANAQSNPQQRAAPAPSQNVQQSKPPVWAQQQRPSQAPANPQRNTPSQAQSRASGGASSYGQSNQDTQNRQRGAAQSQRFDQTGSSNGRGGGNFRR